MDSFLDTLPKLLEGKKIILGICGSVAIYKSLEIIRLLQKLGAQVRVVMSEDAEEFIKPLLFEAISHHSVLTHATQSWGENPRNHIEIAVWGDLFLIAPCSVNTLNKIANGIADNILCESFIAFDKIKCIAPAANTKMLENPISLASLQKLKTQHYTIIAPTHKELACGIAGNGALAEPLEIVFQTIRCFHKDVFWENCAVCVSGGGSKEAIDCVRFISNYSSGKMGASLALSAYFLGANVHFIAPNAPFKLPLEITYTKAESAQDFLQAIMHWQDTKVHTYTQSFLFMGAAISDYIPKEKHKEKLKKQDIGTKWQLDLVENIDILSTLKKKQKTIGFKLESNNALKSAKDALHKKNLDAICLNSINATHNPLESAHNQILWITQTLTDDLGFLDKLSLAFNILHKAKTL